MGKRTCSLRNKTNIIKQKQTNKKQLLNNDNKIAKLK